MVCAHSVTKTSSSLLCFPVVSVRTAPADGVLRMMTVLDVKGIGMGSVTADVLSFIGKSGEIIDNYYPEQVCRTTSMPFFMLQA